MATITRLASRNDPNRPAGPAGRGCAVVDVEGSELPESGHRVSFYRPDSKSFLGPEGWQTDEAWLTPSRVDRSETGGLSLAIPPEIAVELELGANYRFRLLGAGGGAPAEKNLAWRNVTPLSREDRLDVLGRRQPQSITAEASTAAPVAAAPPPPLTTAGAEPLAPHTEPKTGKGPLIGLLVLLLLIAGGGAAWWFTQNKPVEKAAVSVPVAPALSDRDRLAKLMESGTPEELMAAAEGYIKEDKAGEAVMLLRRAGEKGAAEGYRRLGQFYDPGNYRRDASLREAYTYYRKAIDAGSADAKHDLTLLKEQAQQAVKAGDAEADAILQLWRD